MVLNPMVVKRAQTEVRTVTVYSSIRLWLQKEPNALPQENTRKATKQGIKNNINQFVQTLSAQPNKETYCK